MWEAETRRLTPLRVGTILLYRRSYLRGKWTGESLVGNHWRFQTRARPGHCPGKILVNCAYCFKKLSCDIAALLPVSSAWVTWQLWNRHCRWYHHQLVCQNHTQASPIFLFPGLYWQCTHMETKDGEGFMAHRLQQKYGTSSLPCFIQCKPPKQGRLAVA